MEKEYYLHFSCRKCEHQLFVNESPNWAKRLMKDCPNCGEEPYENWIFIDRETKKSVDKRFGW